MAKKKKLVDQDFNQNEIQNAVDQNLATAPSNPKKGQFYFDTATNEDMIWNGTSWVSRTSQGKIYEGGTGINVNGTTISVDTTTIAELSDIKDGATTIQRNGVAIGTITANQTSAATINIIVPTSASDVGALPDDTVIGSANLTIQRNGTSVGTFSANATSATTVNISVPTTATEVGALPSTTTINDLTTTAQQNALNSGVTTTVVSQVGTNASAITSINEKIPSQATSSNQLADKAFVNSSVQTATANFRGNWATWSAVPTNVNDYPEDYAGSKTPTVNDYLVVQDASGYTGETLEGTWRFKYTGTWSTDGKTGWLPEYQINETPMTSAQLAALNSGITAAYVTQIATNTSAISGLSSSKQDVLTAGANIQINGTTISATDTTYVAGSGISITGNTISNTQTSAVWGNIQGTLADQTDLKSVLDSKTTVTFVDWTA